MFVTRTQILAQSQFVNIRHFFILMQLKFDHFMLIKIFFNGYFIQCKSLIIFSPNLIEFYKLCKIKIIY
jgi:hypothetical protein